MENKPENLAQFMLRYSVYGIVPGMWFAYVGGASPLYGALAGLGVTLLVALPSRIVGQNRPLELDEGSE